MEYQDFLKNKQYQSLIRNIQKNIIKKLEKAEALIFGLSTEMLKSLRKLI